jgi:TDG/mug DNA glycosylase family protein
VERGTVDVYERRAADWQTLRPPKYRTQARAFAARCLIGLPSLDVGSGPGSYLPDLGRPLVALDAARAMLALARDVAPEVPGVQADLEALPFRRGCLGGAWARASYLHIARAALPLALARLHDALAVGAPVHLSLRHGEGEGPLTDDEFAGRFFAQWQPDDLVAVVEGAGFEIDETVVQGEWILIDATRAQTLPDFVAAGMRLLVCGLNPSVVAADAGFGYAGPSNRFWKAAVSAGLVSTQRDPWRALSDDGVGMTDMVKRATPRSSLLRKAEYAAGAARVERMVSWLQPGAVMFVGLEGWRAAVDPAAVAGRQAVPFGGRPAYVMPSTSGLNAHARIEDLVEHMRVALMLTEAPRPT